MKEARSGCVTGTAAAEQYFARRSTSGREFACHHGNALEIISAPSRSIAKVREQQAVEKYLMSNYKEPKIDSYFALCLKSMFPLEVTIDCEAARLAMSGFPSRRTQQN
jgi:hypothetical protein